MRWTDSDNLRARDAAVVGGPSAGLLVAVNERGDNGVYRYPDVIDLSGYTFDPDSWEFRWSIPGMAGEAGDGSV